MAGSFLVPMDLPHLDAAIRDVDSATAEVRWVAALALAQEDGARAGEAIEALERLAEDPVEEVRAQAIEGLAGQLRSGRDARMDVLAAALDDGSDLVRMTGLEAVELFADDPVGRVSALLDDDAPCVRIAAARMLAELAAESEVDRLARLLGDADGVVRREVALALARLGDSRGEQLAIEALDDDDASAIAAAMALGMLASPGSVEALERAAGGWFVSAALKGATAAALTRCGDPAGLEIISAMLESVRGSTRMAALMAVAGLPVRGAAARIGALLGKGRSLETSSALRTLVALGEVDRDAAVAEIERHRQGLDGELATEAAEALVALAETPR
ncbi:MAG: HEAT repeat domain-containing protein [Deltaproteobacteria bacterium]|nr:HEAT repeat domain-containing protein [Deltaproteobacteria bacterium]